MINPFHFHSYEIHSVNKKPSIFELVQKYNIDPESTNMKRSDFQGKQIVILKCKKCGKLIQKEFDEYAKII